MVQIGYNKGMVQLLINLLVVCGLLAICLVHILQLTIISLVLPEFNNTMLLIGALSFCIGTILLSSFQEKITIRLTSLLLIFSAVISVLLNDIPSVFQSELRLFAWLIVVMALGGIFYNKTSVGYRNRLFKILVHMYLCLTLLSFLWWLLGLPPLGRGFVTGVMRHTMLLAFVASISTLYAFSRCFSAKGTNLLLWLALTLVCFLMVLIAASRMSIIAVVISLIVVNLRNSSFQKRILFTGVFVTVAILMFSMANVFNIDLLNQFVPQDAVTQLQAKGLNNSRDSLWSGRITEFESSPVFGIGLGSELGDEYLISYKENGRIEPGSSYMSVLSQTGILGVLGLVLMLFYSVVSHFRSQVKLKKDDFIFRELVGVYFAFSLASEGYIFAAGSSVTIFFWLYIGILNEY